MTQPVKDAAPRRLFGGGLWWSSAVTLAAIVLALLAGAILMVVSDPEVISLYAYLFTAPQLPLAASWAKVSSAYAALAVGAVGSP